MNKASSRHSTFMALSFLFATAVSQSAQPQVTSNFPEPGLNSGHGDKEMSLTDIVQEQKASMSPEDIQILETVDREVAQNRQRHYKWVMNNRDKAVPDRDFSELIHIREGYKEGLKTISDNFGPNSVLLPQYMISLCVVNIEFQDYQEALSCYHHMQHIIKKTEGVWGYSQNSFNINGVTVDLLNEIEELHIKMGDHEAASAIADLSFRVNVAKFGKTVPVVTDFAKELMERGSVRRSKELYEQALDLAEEQGLDEIHMVLILEELAFVNRILGKTGDSIDQLKEARDIVTEHSATDSFDKAVAQRKVADMYALRGDQRRAKRTYKKAAKMSETQFDSEPSLLGQKSVRSEALNFQRISNPLGGQVIYLGRNNQNRWAGTAGVSFGPEREPTPLALGSPIAICPATALAYVDNRHVDLQAMQDFTMSVRLTISPSGQVSEIELPGIEDSDIDKRFVQYFEKILRSLRWRPGIEDGKPVETTVEFEQSFDPRQDYSNSINIADPQRTKTVEALGCSYAKLKYGLN